MGSATNTKKTLNFFRFKTDDTDLPDIEDHTNIYLNASERRVTGMTLRILMVNVIALFILLLGFLYLGEYQKNIIAARLETFNAELELVTAAIAQSSATAQNVYDLSQDQNLDPFLARQMIRSLSEKMKRNMDQRIRLFDKNGVLIADSNKIEGPNGNVHIVRLAPPTQEGLKSVQLIKDTMRFALSLLPEGRALPVYPESTSDNIQFYPDARDAIKSKVSRLSAWTNKNEHIFLSAASPLIINNSIQGAVLLTREARDIEYEIEQVWINIIVIFLGTLGVTILLSIYLSGAIEHPLRRLAKAAEKVRAGHGTADDIPDLSHRHDEIGRLSLVLRDMTSALWHRMGMMESFAADVSHELKNPLSSLRSAVETAGIVKKKEDREKLMAIIQHDVERLDRLITDISNASKLDTELARENFKAVNIRVLLSNLLDVYRDPLDRDTHKNHDYEFSVENGTQKIKLNFMTASPLFVRGIETRLAQVFGNLLSNALSFSPENGQVNISVMPLENNIRITVEDQGPGIPPGKLENIFERFYSERPEHESYGTHSGLGLSICKQIIDAHQGDIFAENIEDAGGNIIGACFNVVLPKFVK